MAQSRSQVVVCTILRVAGDVLRFVASTWRPYAQLVAENLFLRKQLALYLERQVKPRRANDATRITLVALSRLIDWRRLLAVVKPETLIRWHRKGFRLFWRWRSMPRGRPRLPVDLRQVIAEMAAANRIWGEERIASELLLKLGIRVSPRTVRRYTPSGRIQEQARLAGVELLCAQSRALDARLRLLRDGHGDVPDPLRFRSPGGGHAPDPPLERDGPSDGGVDGAAVPDGGVGRSAASICRSRPRQHLFRE